MERVFIGSRSQRGYGLGGFFTKLLRSPIPVFRRGGEYLGKKAIRTGLHTMQDIATGANPRASLKRRIAEVSDEMLDDVKRKIRRKMTGQGRVKVKGHRNAPNRKKPKTKRALKKKKQGRKKITVRKLSLIHISEPTR